MRKERMESTMDHTLAARSDFCLERERENMIVMKSIQTGLILESMEQWNNGTMNQWNNDSMKHKISKTYIVHFNR